jgi:hypothetical protein
LIGTASRPPAWQDESKDTGSARIRRRMGRRIT